MVEHILEKIHLISRCYDQIKTVSNCWSLPPLSVVSSLQSKYFTRSERMEIVNVWSILDTTPGFWRVSNASSTFAWGFRTGYRNPPGSWFSGVLNPAFVLIYAFGPPHLLLDLGPSPETDRASQMKSEPGCPPLQFILWDFKNVGRLADRD